MSALPHFFEISLTPDAAADEKIISLEVRKKIGSADNFRIVRRSIDSRQRGVKIILRIEAIKAGEEFKPVNPHRVYPDVSGGQSVFIVGAGPAGLFAALRLVELGLRPIIIERGKDVKARRRDIAAIHKQHLVNPDSNYCFGEGGAGTFSDGKLYTRSTKRGDVKAVLETLVQFGASESILVDAHPHIGTNKLPAVVTAMREQIIRSGGVVRFSSTLVDFSVNLEKHIDEISIKNAEGIVEKLNCEHLILATGHSARDIFQMLRYKKIGIEFKPFAMGVRVEHPQQLIDSAQYHCRVRSDFLPPATYQMVYNAGKRSAYSFCMCPGGIIAPCATAAEEVVSNGWSPSKRNNPWANSGMVVPVGWDDVSEFHDHGPLAGLFFRQRIEKACWDAAGRTQALPAQRLIDFVEGKISATLPGCSYQPGIVSAPLHRLLPQFIATTLRHAFAHFGKKMNGYLTNDAIVVAPESRTSSPVRIPRHKENLSHDEIENFYPCGEGAGYAGGIVSAAIDGIRVAEKIAQQIERPGH